SGNINGDFEADIIFANHNSKIWGYSTHLGSYHFSPPSIHTIPYSPTDIKSGFLNDDEYEDVVIGGADLSVILSQDAEFLTLTFDEGAMDIEISDLDNDGDNDIIGFNNLYFSTQVLFYENSGNSDFFVHTPWDFTPGCYHLSVSDFNNDSLPDLFYHSNNDVEMYLFYNLGNFVFEEPVSLSFANYGESMRFSSSADFDGNGYNDLVIIRSHGAPLPVGNVSILYNDGNGNFLVDPITFISTNTAMEVGLACNPNPFIQVALISFRIPDEAFAQLNIFDLSGRLVINLADQNLKTGDHEFLWYGKDFKGKEVPSGIYLALLLLSRPDDPVSEYSKHATRIILVK
ncbi:MAG: VCBS repeat-containing protein, partial [Bacteroidales bacterium]|nr:VCBS repeat-containing protein [Bacteroidales bacterium]